MQRFIVERISDGKFLELELPIDVSSASVKLAGFGRFAGTLDPDVGALRDARGSLIVDPYATYIHEDVDGVIRGTWLVTRSEIDGDVWAVEGAGFTSFFSGRPFEGEYWGVRVDPLDAARNVVQHAQSAAAADVGVVLVGASSVRVGTDSDLKADAAKRLRDQRKRQWDDFAKPRKRLQAEVKAIQAPYVRPLQILNRERRVLQDVVADRIAQKRPQSEIDAAKAAVTAKAAQIKTQTDARAAALGNRRDLIEDMIEAEKPVKEAYERAKDDYDKAKDAASEDEGAWKQLWWDTPDCFELISEAIDAAGYEWVEWSGWNADKSAIRKEIRCTPRVGTKRSGLAFVEGANILETVVVEDDSGSYANTVVAVGAGEGKDSLRVTVGERDGRRRKVYVLDAKHVTRKTTLENLARAELSRRLQKLKVSDIRVDGAHPNSMRGTFGVGDTILVDADVEPCRV